MRGQVHNEDKNAQNLKKKIIIQIFFKYFSWTFRWLSWTGDKHTLKKILTTVPSLPNVTSKWGLFSGGVGFMFYVCPVMQKFNFIHNSAYPQMTINIKIFTKHFNKEEKVVNEEDLASYD